MITSLLLALTFQSPAQLPIKPVRLTLADPSGAKVAFPTPKAKATVVIFVSVDCPIANRFAPEIGRIGKEYSPKGVNLVLAYPDKSSTPAAVREHLKAFGLSTHAALDTQHKLLKACGASVTPHAVILNSAGQVVYLGRINDLFEEHGVTKAKVTRADLRIALDEFLAGSKISKPVTQAVGCWIGD